MYSNPSMFAPKVKANGGEAYPQAPTMNQFFDYGHPTPQVPFVFQTGGMMDFSGEDSTRRSDFLNKIKEAAAAAVQKEFENEAFDYEEEADSMFQTGGPFAMDFSKANAWASAQQPSNFYDAASNFATLWDAAQTAPTDTYIKRWKQQQLPIAQTGLENKNDWRDQLSLYPENEYIPETPNEDPLATMTRDQRLAYERSRRNLAPGTVMDQVTANDSSIKNQALADQRAREMGLDPLTGKMMGKDMTPIMEKDPADWRNHMMIPGRNTATTTTTTTPGANTNQTIVEKAVEDAKKKEEEKKVTPPAAGSDVTSTSPDGTQIVTNADGTQSSISPQEAARRKAEADKKNGANPETPAPGSEEESNAAAAAGMSPEQYRTFLSRATINNRRAMLPGNRLRSMDFYFDTYGPGMNSITASAQGARNTQQGQGTMQNPQNPADVPGARSNQPGAPKRSGFLNKIFGRADEQSRWNPENDVSRFSSKVRNIESPVMESQFETQGYSDKNYISDLRNVMATNRLNRLGQRIDRNMQREMALDKFYGAPISDRMQRLRDRDLRRYNRTADRFTRDEYLAPAFAMGGGMAYFQPGGENDIYGMDGYSMDGYDTSQQEDYAGNTIYQQAPAEYQAQTPDQKVGSNKMTAIFGHYNPYEAPMMLAGLQATAGLMDRRNQRKLQGEWMGKTSADQVYTKDFEKDRGDYTMNEGYFRPDDMVPVKNAGYNFQSFNAKMGGSYKKGGEYYLSDEEIQRIIDMGGEVEFLED